MFRYYVKMKKGNKEIYGEAWTLALIVDYITQQEQEGFKVVESNFDYVQMF